MRKIMSLDVMQKLYDHKLQNVAPHRNDIIARFVLVLYWFHSRLMQTASGWFWTAFSRTPPCWFMLRSRVKASCRATRREMYVRMTSCCRCAKCSVRDWLLCADAAATKVRGCHSDASCRSGSSWWATCVHRGMTIYLLAVLDSLARLPAVNICS